MGFTEKFNVAFERTIGLEVGSFPDGGYTNDPLDAGGETKWGISKRAHPNLDIANLSKNDAKSVYHGKYWQPLGLDDFAEDVACEIFDTAVNMGLRRAVEIVQRAVAYFGHHIAQDGIMGPKTRAAVQAIRATELLKVLNALQLVTYEEIIRNNPSQQRFARGWLKRIEIPRAA